MSDQLGDEWGGAPGRVRPLPQDLETERALLGAILVRNELIIQVGDVLSPDDFFPESHRRIYAGMLVLYQSGKPIDELTLKNQVDSVSKDSVSLSLLAGLTDGVPRLSNVAQYADMIRNRSIQRKMILAAQDIFNRAYSHEGDIKELLHDAETQIFDIAQTFVKKNYIPLSQAVFDAFEYLSKLYESKSNLTGISTGYDTLDVLTCGLQRGDLIILAARPSMGKTTLAVNIAMNAAMRENAIVAIFSLEMSARQLALRIISSEARMDGQKIRSGYVSKSDWEGIGQAIARLESCRVFIDETAGLSVLEIQSKARRIKREFGLDMVVIDYLQLMRSDVRRGDNRVAEISEISRSLKAMAKDLDVPVIALSQLSRAPETRKGDHRPMLSDLRDSGSIEQDADVVLFIFRPEFYIKDDPSLENVAEVILEKQRNGPRGVVRLAYLKEFNRFENMAM